MGFFRFAAALLSLFLVAGAAGAQSKALQKELIEASGLGQDWSAVRFRATNAKSAPVTPGVPWDGWYDADNFRGIPGVFADCPTSFATKGGKVVAFMPSPSSPLDSRELLRKIGQAFGPPHEDSSGGPGTADIYRWTFGKLRIEVTDFSRDPGWADTGMMQFEIAWY